MSKKPPTGEQLKSRSMFHYACGCVAVEGVGRCPIHDKPILEHMIYGTDSVSSLNEKEDYKSKNLNESR